MRPTRTRLMATAREYIDLARLAEEQGWCIERARNNHLRWIPPDGGKAVVTCSTPSDHRSFLNDRSRLRKAGLELPRKDGRRAD
jgi:hypothetical protein